MLFHALPVDVVLRSIGPLASVSSRGTGLATRSPPSLAGPHSSVIVHRCGKSVPLLFRAPNPFRLPTQLIGKGPAPDSFSNYCRRERKHEMRRVFLSAKDTTGCGTAECCGMFRSSATIYSWTVVQYNNSLRAPPITRLVPPPLPPPRFQDT